MVLKEVSKAVVDEILAEINKIQKDDSITDKKLPIELDQTKGDVEEAIRLINELHSKSTDVYAEVSSKGTIGIAGTLVAAAGKPELRTCSVDTTFELVNGNPTVEDMLYALTGKKRSIKGFLTEKKLQLSADEALRCGIVDNISKFKSKYA